jgi:peptide/nickel transport system substrate-binding protein
MRSPGGDKLPYLEGIIYMIVQSEDMELLKFLEGELDAYEVKGSDFPILKPEEERLDFTVFELGPDFGTNFLVFNQNTGKNPATGNPYVDPSKAAWFTDINFRRAMAHVIDKKKILEILKNGLGYEQNSAVSPASGFFHNPDVKTYEYNLETAKKILFDAGYSDRNGDGLIEDKDGNPLRFNFYTNAGNEERIQIAGIIRHDIEQLGIAVNFQVLEFNTLVSKLNGDFGWEAILLGLTGGGDPHFGKNVWMSGGQLHMWYPLQASPATPWEKRIDEIFVQGVQELDEEKRKILYDEFQVIVSEQLPLIYTVLGSNITAVRNKFGNLDPTNYGGVFHNLEEIYIKK